MRLTESGIATLEMILKHAKQGAYDPRFAKNQCQEIVTLLEPLVTLIRAFDDKESP